MRPTFATLVYCVDGDRVLLLERAKPPHVGCWVGPGGKIEDPESPVECAIRELGEETGLVARRIALRGVIREVSPRVDWQWLLFLYVVTAWDGELTRACPEGVLRWWRAGALPRTAMPEADRTFLPRILGRPPPAVYEARYEYDAELALRDIVEQRAAGAAREVPAW